jgi:hypothetical protein
MDYLPYICAAVLICLIAGFFYAARWLLEQYLPPTPEEIAQREAERIAKKANKEFKQRQRVLRVWNIFN